MGSTERSESRRVSFGTDEEERVRVLQGIRLSENVVNRMKDSSQPSEGQHPPPVCVALQKAAPQHLRKNPNCPGRRLVVTSSLEG